MAIPSVDHFNHLYRTYYPALCYYALKIVANEESAKDIVEEVYTKLILSKQEFDISDNVRAWLYTSTRNACLNYLKLEKHARERQFEYSLNQENEDTNYDYELTRAEILHKIMQEIKHLPGNSGKVIEMSYVKGMKNEQIAEELGLSEKTVRNLKSTGLATLKARLPLDLFLLLLLSAGSAGGSTSYFT